VTPIAAALRDRRRAFTSIVLFSGIVNLLMLAGPLYMLQIYDRVLNSRSIPTLVMLSVLLVGAYVFQGMLDLIRSRVVVRAAAVFDQHLAVAVHGAAIGLGISQPVRDLDQIRTFLIGTGPIAMVDLPWVPIFLAICFLIHPWLGLVATAGAVVLFTMTLLTERASRKPARAAAEEGGVRSVMVEAGRRGGETIAAMGMAGSLAQRWAQINDRYIAATTRLSDVASGYGSTSKVLRLMLQSMILGFGAYLVLNQELTAGAMIAASIMMGRALAPIETAIANWRTFISARQSMKRLSEVLTRAAPRSVPTTLPPPIRSLDVEQAIIAAPGAAKPIVTGAHFSLKSGEALGVIGPSGAGKTSLIRALVGIWPPVKGSVRLDGAEINQWDPELLGRHVGFVSQTVELFDGTVSENIARMAIAPDTESVLRAARAAGAHDMILRLSSGYDTKVGEGGEALSGGQRQRIALARALYGDPFLVVLDEPNANLDSEGEQALHEGMLALKARGAIVVLIAHRPAALSVCDRVLVLANGVQQTIGQRDDVLRKLLERHASLPKAGNLKVVNSGGMS
jgi:PrtD family type I secretion system ABC transporter